MGAKSRQLSVVSYQFKRLTTLATTIVLIGLITGCSGVRPGEIRRIALLAPFEGRYREVGYDAYYAVKLAMQDAGDHSIELLAVDDGGTANSAVNRARALAGDPLVELVIALGNNATQTETQAALGDKPMLIVGQWGSRPDGEHVFMLDSQGLGELLTDKPADDITLTAQINTPMIGNEMLALKQFPLLNPSLELVTIASSGSLPDDDFNTRYLSSAEFVPQPGLLTSLAYDATRIALEALYSESNVTDALIHTDFEGINGRIQFQNGYWKDAPIHCYGYDQNGELFPKDCPIK
jgi:ABC-type branched-subunit amino acid transport system substrate-binding protein